MKKIVIILGLIGLLLPFGCKNQNNTDMSNSEPLKEVTGRKNFGPDHALVTTPQPCVMIATWDKDHNPDVMMAAWAGQYDYKRIVVSLSKHKTTENLELTGAFTVSFADIRTVAESDYFGLVMQGGKLGRWHPGRGGCEPERLRKHPHGRKDRPCQTPAHCV